MSNVANTEEILTREHSQRVQTHKHIREMERMHKNDDDNSHCTTFRTFTVMLFIATCYWRTSAHLLPLCFHIIIYVHDDLMLWKIGFGLGDMSGTLYVICVSTIISG